MWLTADVAQRFWSYVCQYNTTAVQDTACILNFCHWILLLWSGLFCNPLFRHALFDQFKTSLCNKQSGFCNELHHIYLDLLHSSQILQLGTVDLLLQHQLLKVLSCIRLSLQCLQGLEVMTKILKLRIMTSPFRERTESSRYNEEKTRSN